MENLFKTIAEKIHCNAKDKGFWDAQNNILSKMGESVLFTDIKITQVKKAFFAQRLALITSEISEVLDADRKNKVAQLSQETFNSLDVLDAESFKASYEQTIKGTVEEEMADVLIRLLDTCEGFGIDLYNFMLQKMRYNAGRGKLHGKEY